MGNRQCARGVLALDDKLEKEVAAYQQAIEDGSPFPWMRKYKLLCLGGGSSGKSTLMKGFRVMYDRVDEDYEQARLQYLRNCAETLNSWFYELVGLSAEYTELEKYTDDDLNWRDADAQQLVDFLLQKERLRRFRESWLGMKHALLHLGGSEFPVLLDILRDDEESLLHQCLRIHNDDAGQRAYLQYRKRTCGIQEFSWSCGASNSDYVILDVGGPRSDRRRWAQCFQNVSLLVFCVSLDGLISPLYEDETVNRWRESRKLFSDIGGSKWFRDTNIALCFSHYDVFEKMMADEDTRGAIQEAHPRAFHCGSSPAAVAKQMQRRFMHIQRPVQKPAEERTGVQARTASIFMLPPSDLTSIHRQPLQQCLEALCISGLKGALQFVGDVQSFAEPDVFLFAEWYTETQRRWYNFLAIAQYYPSSLPATLPRGLLQFILALLRRPHL